MAVKILTSIDNFWPGLPYQNLISLPVNSATTFPVTKNHLKMDWQHWSVPSQSLLWLDHLTIVFFTGILFLWQLVHFPRNVANHVQLLIKWKPANNIRNLSEGSGNKIFFSFRPWKYTARQYKLDPYLFHSIFQSLPASL